MDVVIDTKGNSDLINRDQLLESDDDDDVEIKTVGMSTFFILVKYRLEFDLKYIS